MAEPKQCAQCGLDESTGAKLSTCSCCKTTVYCCKECQKKDWPKHRAARKALAASSSSSPRAGYAPASSTDSCSTGSAKPVSSESNSDKEASEFTAAQQDGLADTSKGSIGVKGRPTTATAGGKKKDLDARVCSNCPAVLGRAGIANLECKRCGLVAYCCKACQREHWKANHKQFCIAKADRAPPQATLDNAEAASDERRRTVAAKTAAAGDECAICLEPLTEASAATLPCAHVFHTACVEVLRKFGAIQACPLCRAVLPPGPEKLYEDALQRYMVVAMRVKRGEASWGALTTTEQQEMNEVMRLWMEAADQGHAQAQWAIASIFDQGQGVKQDYVEANKWYRKAADQGHAKAQFNLGISYAQGQGVKQDYVEANKWCRKAAEQGYANAQFNLGISYAQGQGVKQDYAEANKWYRKAADQGFADAQLNLGISYTQGQGVKQDYAEANMWYRKAADQGLAGAQFNLGIAYAQGKGAKQDFAKSVRLWRKAAEQGDADAQFALAQFYEHGLGGLSKSITKAIDLYSKVSVQSDFQHVEHAKAALDRLRTVGELTGARAALTGLQAKPELNGATGVVKSFSEATGRYTVQLDTGGEPVMVKEANLKRV